MKILYINHFPLIGSGSGVYTNTIAKSFAKKGNSSIVIYPDNNDKTNEEENITYYPVLFKSHKLPFDFPCFTTHPLSTFAFTSMTDEEKKLYEDVFRDKIEEVIIKEKPDIIHGNHIWTLSGIGAELAKKYHIPLVLTCHGTCILGVLEEEKLKHNWGTKWAHIAADYSDRIITISNDNKQNVERIFPNNKDKTVLIKNGINTDVFKHDKAIDKEQVLKDFNIPGNYDKIVTFAGKLTYIKGVDTLLDAATIYEDDNTLTIIAGDGEAKEDLIDLAKKNNLKNVFFIGNRSQEELNKLFNIATCSVVSSRKDAFGLVAAEAMASGAPVIVTNHGGLKDLVNDEVGFLFEIGNHNTLAKDILKILNKEVIFDKNKISQYAISNFSQDKMVKEVEKIYEEAIKNRLN